MNWLDTLYNLANNKKDFTDFGDIDFNLIISDEEDDIIPPIDIIINEKIRNKYKKGWDQKIRKKPITECTIHGTGGGSLYGITNWMLSGERSFYYNKGIGLFHYLVGKDGTIIEILNPDYWVWHSNSGNHDKETIGIELINSNKNNANMYTEEQYNALFDLLFNYLFKLYPTINNISSHRTNIIKYNRNYKKYLKQCPGKNFRWERVEKELIDRGFTFESLRWDSKVNIKKVQ